MQTDRAELVQSVLGDPGAELNPADAEATLLLPLAEVTDGMNLVLLIFTGSASLHEAFTVLPPAPCAPLPVAVVLVN